ncbi:hypothetical protein FQN54_007173 [Arachnomyces sp. PD_36]|nr:hypothetical protein FQN54_007173 [Arachnomyces sp. PD_36]
MDVIVIGAGFAGICALIKLLERFPNATVQVFEKADDIGGTWLKNTYPALSCDIPSQLYSYSFAPNQDWSAVYATQPEILGYIRQVVSTHNCLKNIQLKQECLSATWSNVKCLWHVKFLDHDTGEVYTRVSRVLLTAVGFSDIPKDPEDIQGINTFSGRIFHSANWDHSFDFRGKDILVVGNGCSANQFIPWLVKNGDIRSLVQIVKSAHWIAPKENHAVSATQKWYVSHLTALTRIGPSFKERSSDGIDRLFRKFPSINRILAQRHSRLYQKVYAADGTCAIPFTPNPGIPFGAKRPVMDHGYLEALHDERVKVMKSPSLEVVASSRLRTESGEEFTADVIILAHGFKTQQLLTPMTISGEDGQQLPDIWQQDGQAASAYMGVAVANFPNLFLLTGPNSLPSGHSTLISIECSVEYILRLLKRVLPQPHSPGHTNAWLHVKKDAQDAYNGWIQEKLQGTVYTSDVRSWYIDQRTGKNTLIWPGSQFAFWWSRCVKPVRWSDFEGYKPASKR